jgi:hypothetical protein
MYIVMPNSNRNRRKRIKGGSNVVFPPTFPNNTVASNPQSYLSSNNFANDPGYSVIAARNTGPFLTGVSSGGKKRQSKKSKSNKQAKYIRKLKTRKNRKNKNKKMRGGGGSDATSAISNLMNSTTSYTGILPSPAINEVSGVAGIMSGFSGTGSSYNSASTKIAPLA